MKSILRYDRARGVSLAKESVEAYERRKERERKRQAAQSQEGRDIGEIPCCGDDDLRADVLRSFKLFCEVCFPRRFRLEWSEDHLYAIQQIEQSAIEGKTFALAMPRGHGKTALAVVACLWAVLTGNSRYVVLIGADKKKASRLLSNLKRELQANEMLYYLFPEVCYPIRKLENRPQRAAGQMYKGKQTHIEWTGTQIVLATIPGMREAAIFEVFGLQAGIRGCQYTTIEGDLIRPDLFVLDDPQTDKSAASESQTETRMDLIDGAVLGLAGPDETIAGFALVTVIRRGDLADQLLDNEKNPEWNGYRCKLIYEFPTNTALWEQYFSIRDDEGFKAATEYYRQNYDAMNEGAVISWKERYRRKKGEISGIQHAMELQNKNPAKFASEYQNEPEFENMSVDLLEVNDIMKKCNGFLQGICPPQADVVTAFIDVHGELLYWSVVAFHTPTFTGWSIDRGTLPEQPTSHFVMRTCREKLSKKYWGMGLEARIRQALWDLLTMLGEKRYRIGDSNKVMRIRAIGVDAGWGPTSKTVQTVCYEHPLAHMVIATFGRGLKASDREMHTWNKKPGERRGDNWIARPNEEGLGRYLIFNSNYWKTFFHSRLFTAQGDRGCFDLFKPRFAGQHRLVAEHYRVEKPHVDKANGREVEIWKMPPNKPDQHFFDTDVGCHVIASTCGTKLPGNILPKRKRRSRPTRPRPTELKI